MIIDVHVNEFGMTGIDGKYVFPRCELLRTL